MLAKGATASPKNILAFGERIRMRSFETGKTIVTETVLKASERAR